jgi:hypothetical protein
MSAKPSSWVALTDEDRQAVHDSLPDALGGFMKLWGWLHFAKAIEDKAREKNEALNAVLLEALKQLVEETDRWNVAVTAVIGRQPNTGIALESARAAIRLANGEGE